MIINRSNSIFENFMGLIKESNPSFSIPTEEQVILGIPVTDYSVAGRNTCIEITAVSNMGFSGTRTLYYNRCDIQELFDEGLVPLNIDLEGDDTPNTLSSRILGLMGTVKNQLILNGGLPVEVPDYYDESIVEITAPLNSVIFDPNTSGYVTINNPSGEDRLLIDYRFEDWVGGTTVRNIGLPDRPGTRLGDPAGPTVGLIGNSWNFNKSTYVNTGLKTPKGPVSGVIRLRLNSLPTTAESWYALINDAINDSLPYPTGVVFNIASTKQLTVGISSPDNSVDTPVLSQIVTGQWMTLGYSLEADLKTVKFFVNGALVFTGQTPQARQPVKGRGPIHIGFHDGVGKQLDGLVDRVVVYARTLSDAEHAALHQTYATKNSNWSATDIGPGAYLQSGGRVGVSVAASACRGEVWRSSGKYMFEFTRLTSAQTALVGVGKTTASVDRYPGYDSNGWSYYSLGDKYCGGNKGSYGPAWNIGDGHVIGVLVDFTAKTIEFALNGERLGVAFTDNNLNGPVAPMFGGGSLSADGSLGILNTGEDGFAFPFAGFNAWAPLVDGSRMIASLIHPIAVVPGETNAQFKERLAAWFGVPSSWFKLGAGANDAFTLPSQGSNDLLLDITSVNEDFWLNNGTANKDKISVRFPYLLIDDIPNWE